MTVKNVGKIISMPKLALGGKKCFCICPCFQNMEVKKNGTCPMFSSCNAFDMQVL